jgi:hypothetical protein
MFSKRNVWARPPKRYKATNFHETGLRVYRATQLPASTPRPKAILNHVVWSALGEMFLSEKKLSRRRRKTFGNDDTFTESPTDCCCDASDGTRSSMSGFRLKPLVGRHWRLRIDWPAADRVAQTAPLVASDDHVSSKSNEDQGNINATDQAPGAHAFRK